MNPSIYEAGPPALDVFTLWSPEGEHVEGWEVDLDKHQAFTHLVNNLLADIAPWLPALVIFANARVMAAPGKFMIATPDGEIHSVPQLAALLTLTPWNEPTETPH